MQNTFTGVFEKIEDWYIGYVQELPGANVQEKTLEEARESLREAIELILRSNRELAEKELSGKDIIREQIKVIGTPALKAGACVCEAWSQSIDSLPRSTSSEAAGTDSLFRSEWLLIS